ncbi:MAG: hypothetical protein K1X79_04195 [Oligoflexia bacterium]|nr:hypothetical protein [Oligoflexia bacterium]
MLHILGAGAAHPAGSISNEFLVRCQSAFDASWLEHQIGINSRATVLPLDYILESGNLDTSLSYKVATASPTDLSFSAAQQALQRAGISPEQVGLVIGAGETPVETTPSEGQRLAGRFGLRIPAFDVCSGMESLPLHLDQLRHWRPEALPDYVLLVYSSCPTTRVNYKQGREGALFGDGAGALVISPRIGGKLQVAASAVWKAAPHQRILSVDTYAHLGVDFAAMFELAASANFHTAKLALQSLPTPTKLTFIPAQLSAKCAQRFKELGAGSYGAVHVQSAQNGCCLGASFAIALSDLWDGLSGAAQDLLLVSAGLGHNNAWVQLRVGA